MAKVMISMPDELLARVDRSAKDAGTSRSGWLRELAERAVDQETQTRAAEIRELLSHARHFGGDATAAIRADRNRDSP